MNSTSTIILQSIKQCEAVSELAALARLMLKYSLSLATCLATVVAVAVAADSNTALNNLKGKMCTFGNHS